MIIMFCGISGSGKTVTAKILSEILAKFGRVKLILSEEISGKVYKPIFRVLKESLNEMDYIFG
jgi:thymidylate kinase